MKYIIKTLRQQSLVVELDPGKTVLELKQELSYYPDVGVSPELQKLIYNGKVLSNVEILSNAVTDAKKNLVVMVLKRPEDGERSTTPEAAKPNENESAPSTSAANKNEKEETKSAEQDKEAAVKAKESDVAATVLDKERESLVQNIVGMGYPRDDVVRALQASFYNPERAIEYLVDGLPEEADFEESDSELDIVGTFRSDSQFQELRRLIQEDPTLLEDAVRQMGLNNPDLLALIDRHPREFFEALTGDDEEGDDDSEDGQE